MSSQSYSVCEYGGSWFSPIEHHTDVTRACISAENLTQLYPEQRFRVYDNNSKQFVDSGGVVFRTHRYQVHIKIGNLWCPMTRFNELDRAAAWVSNYDPDGTIPVKIKDHEQSRYMELDEVFRILKPTVKEQKNLDWKEQGF